MANVSLKGAIETRFQPFTLPQGLKIYQIDMGKMGIIGTASGGRLEISYFGIPMFIKIDAYGHTKAEFKWPFATMNNVFTQGNCQIEVSSNPSDFMERLQSLVEELHHHTAAHMSECLSNRESNSEFFPDVQNFVNLSMPDKSFCLGGFILQPRINRQYVQVKCALGYHFRDKKILARMDTGDGMKTLDADTWKGAVTPMVRAIKRIKRGTNPWSSPWSSCDEDE